MFDFDESFILAFVAYIGACVGLYLLKHPKMFDENGNFRHFGLHKSETVFPFWLVSTIIGITTYYIVILWRIR